MSPVVLNKLDERTDVTLYVEMKMEPYDYSALNGEYGSLETIKAKVTELQFGSCDVKLVKNTDDRLKAFAGWEYLWVCPKCNNSERNGTCNNLCQHCCYCVRSKWDDIHMSRGDIYIAGGGSISICHPIGIYKMIKKQ